MVKVIEVDEKNQVVQHYSAQVTLPNDVITLKPGVPPIVSPEFDEYLREWNRVHNPQMVEVAA